MIKVVIIDDEILARKRVVELLQLHGHIDIVEQADNGQKAIQLIEEERPELIFLDIHLPDMSGFEVLERLSYQPKIIFTTAYEEYALKAFEKLSIDYLVKPLTQKQMDQAMDKLGKLQSYTGHGVIEQLLKLVKTHEQKKTPISLPIKKENKIILVDFEDIVFFKAEDKYLNVVLENGKNHLLDKSLSTLQTLLPYSFIRVHRSYIVNRNFILEIEKYFKGTLILTMRDKTNSRIKTGETYSKIVKGELGI